MPALPPAIPWSATAARTARTSTRSIAKTSFSAKAAGCLGRMASTQACPVKLDDPSLFKTQSYINGEWRDAAKKFKVLNPANEEQVIAECPELGVQETREAVKHAHAAYLKWNKVTPKERADKLATLFRLLQDNADDIARLITLENGKPFAEAKGEAAYGSSFIDWYAGEAVRERGDVAANMFPGLRNVVIKQGIGVCGIITPWNFPLAMGTRKIGAAIAAGATCVMKAPGEAPLTSLAFAELCHRAGIPAGVVNIITAQEGLAEVGKELCENPTIRKVSFTGSTRVGKLLMSQSSSTVKKMSLELGGNAPFIVFDDADLDAAAAGAIACKFRGAGQTCICANRIYVHDSVYDAFAQKLVEKVKALKMGQGFDEGVNIGPLIHGNAVKKVQHHVDDAVSKGAKVLAGGKHVKGNFFEPTVLADMKQDSAVTSEETFGPLAALYRFKTEEEVVALANDSEVGLAGYFFSRDIGRIWRVAEDLEVGMVAVNTGAISQPTIPFGGVKQSGVGREGGKYGIEDYQSIKLIAMGGLS